MPFTDITKSKALMRAEFTCECTEDGHGHDGRRCSKPLDPQEPFEGRVEFHHIRAEADGGSDELSNCQVLCDDPCHRMTDSYGRHSGLRPISPPDAEDI